MGITNVTLMSPLFYWLSAYYRLQLLKLVAEIPQGVYN